MDTNDSGRDERMFGNHRRFWNWVLLGLLSIPALPGVGQAQSFELEFSPVASGFKDPVHIAFPPGGEGVMAVVEEGGLIYLLPGGDRESSEPFFEVVPAVPVDIVAKVKLLSIAFHPDYATNGRFFISYGITTNDGKTSFIVSEFTVAKDTGKGNPASERTFLNLTQPFNELRGGGLAFGKDKTLYIGVGDGGGSHDPKKKAQDRSEMLGKILRLNVDEGDPYIPPLDNPFVVNDKGLREIYALGFRDPWKLSIDRANGELWVGDRGSDTYEEVNLVRAGSNHGWNRYEGKLCLRMRFECQDDTLSIPTVTYPHSYGSKVTAGFRYRGRLSPDLAGYYVYGDQVSGRISGIAMDGDSPTANLELKKTDMQITAFGEDSDGEIYLADGKTGTIYRLSAHRAAAAKPSAANGSAPAKAAIRPAEDK